MYCRETQLEDCPNGVDIKNNLVQPLRVLRAGGAAPFLQGVVHLLQDASVLNHNSILIKLIDLLVHFFYLNTTSNSSVKCCKNSETIKWVSYLKSQEQFIQKLVQIPFGIMID